MIRKNDYYGLIDIVIDDRMFAVRTLCLEYCLIDYRDTGVVSKLTQIQVLAMIEETLNPDSDGWM